MKSTEMNNDSEPPSCEPPSCEPPSCEPLLCLQPIFMIGRDSRGNWVVRDKSGTRGGLFVDRAEALRYIRFESADSVLVTDAGCLELDMTAPAIAPRRSGSRDGPIERRH
jgi:hypothetical protein